MKRKLARLSERYVAALQKQLRQCPQAVSPCGPARRLGREAAALKLETLDVARIHEGALSALEASVSMDGVIKRARVFFAEAVTPIEETHLAALKANIRLSSVRASLTAFAAVEQLDAGKRTVLFRVAQEALTNVGRHAQASRVEVSIQKLPDGIGMKIRDDGRSFDVERALQANGGKHLGLLGMRERLEMVGGKFVVESSPGKGTTIQALIPPGRARAIRRRKKR